MGEEKTPRPLFTAEDLCNRVPHGGRNCECDGDFLAKKVNARLAPLVEALERLDESYADSTAWSNAASDVLAEYRKLREGK